MCVYIDDSIDNGLASLGSLLPPHTLLVVCTALSSHKTFNDTRDTPYGSAERTAFVEQHRSAFAFMRVTQRT